MKFSNDLTRPPKTFNFFKCYCTKKMFKNDKNKVYPRRKTSSYWLNPPPRFRTNGNKCKKLFLYFTTSNIMIILLNAPSFHPQTWRRGSHEQQEKSGRRRGRTRAGGTLPTLLPTPNQPGPLRRRSWAGTAACRGPSRICPSPRLARRRHPSRSGTWTSTLPSTKLPLWNPRWLTTLVSFIKNSCYCYYCCFIKSVLTLLET